MKRMQRIISWLACCLMIAMLPMQAFAENEPVESAAIDESWIRAQIDGGNSQIALEGDLVLSNDYVLPQGVFLQFNGHTITVPTGRTLTVRGQLGYWWEQGGLIVESGGTLINNGFIGCSGILDIRGSFSGDFVHTAYVLGGLQATISGLEDSRIWMHYVVDNGDPQSDHQEIFLEYLDLMNSTDYGWYSLQLHGRMTLPCDLVIPYNCYFVLESATFTLTIPAERKITNYGEFRVYADQTVENYGTVENAGNLNVQGSWIGNQPVNVPMSQDQLEQAMAKGDYYYLNAEVVLERDMTISKWFGIQPGARLVVPRGVKLTVAANLCVMAGGTLDIQGDYELVPLENGHRSIGLYLENGVYSTISGVDAEDMSLNCMVYNTEQLMNAMDLANSTDYGWDFAYVYQDVAFTEDTVVNAFIQVTNGATVTVMPEITVTNDYRMEFWEGTTLINQGEIDNRRELILFGGANLNNQGSILVDGVLATYGGVVNSGTVTCSADGYLAVEGAWEGNAPIAAHEHTYTDVVTQPNCIADGYTTHTCSACGYSYRDKHIYATGLHIFANDQDTDCDTCGYTRELRESRPVVHMFRMYDPNSGEHFYTGSETERENLMKAGWNYEGVGFSFPLTTGDPVYRLYDPVYGEHLYTMDPSEKATLEAAGWNYEGIAFNSGFADEVPQYRMHNPNETRGAYHFTASLEERENLLAAGWEYQGIGWYSCWK